MRVNERVQIGESEWSGEKEKHSKIPLMRIVSFGETENHADNCRGAAATC